VNEADVFRDRRPRARIIGFKRFIMLALVSSFLYVKAPTQTRRQTARIPASGTCELMRLIWMNLRVRIEYIKGDVLKHIEVG
jgi:hypothetical protein